MTRLTTIPQTPQHSTEQLRELLPFLTQQERDEMDELLAVSEAQTGSLPTLGQLRNSGSGKFYHPHHADELDFVTADTPRWILAKGGEGSGKSVAGIVKTLGKLARGCSPGLMGSPDFEHFKRSLWPEFRAWCPWDFVVPSQRHRATLEWTPNAPFSMVFDIKLGGAARQVVLMCGGFDNPASWHGPNLQFAHFDEARRHKDASMLKVLDGRIRLSGPHGEPPQAYITSTPKNHWLFDYFGPKLENDPFGPFKDRTRVILLRTRDNAANLVEGYADVRGNSLTAREARVFLDAEWEDEEESSPFLPGIEVWDACFEEPPRIDFRRHPMVIALDAGVTNDLFALTGVTRHPDPKRHNDVFVWMAKIYKPEKTNGGEVDFSEVMADLQRMLSIYNVVEVTYDPYQLAFFGQQLRIQGRVRATEFQQGAPRSKSDKALRDMILQRRLAHGDLPVLRQHLRNADQKRNPEDNQLRIVKRSQGEKIDAAVSLSMSTARCLELPL